MRMAVQGRAAWFLGVWLVIVIAGCASAPAHREQPSSRAAVKIACGKCYEVIRKSRHSASRRKVHACPDCKSDMTIYEEDGVAMARCTRCAPDGFACDKCLPPNGDGK